MDAIIKIWVYLIKTGKKTIEECPEQIKTQVQEKLN